MKLQQITFGEGALYSVVGIAVVFVALLAIIVIVKLMSAGVKGLKKPEPATPAAQADPVAMDALALGPNADRTMLIALLSAAVAAAMDTDASGLRILSIKKLS